MTVTRRKDEFYCSTECKKYFKLYLRSNMNGNYTVKCPNCGHAHHRVITNGHVTGDRCNSTSIQKDVLIGLAATISNAPDHNSPENRRANMGVM